MIHWRYVHGEKESASWGLAVDEYLTRKYAHWEESDYPEPTLRIYSLRSHCALVGRFQNAEAEVDVPYCREHGIEIGRRMTGSGAVMMGEDQLMIAVACAAEHPMIPSHPARILPKLAKGIIAGLEELGIEAEYRPKNDIVVNGRKIGGTALAIEETGSLLYQATLLLDFDIQLMLRVLRIPPEKMSDKGIESHEERLTTVLRERGRPIVPQRAREAVCRGFERAFRMLAVHQPLSEDELAQVKELERHKYLTDEWVFQRQPAPDMLGTSIAKTPAGLIRVYVALAGDTIKSVLITGDFIYGSKLIRDIEAALKWGRADRDAIARVVKVAGTSTGEPVEGLDLDELADIIFTAARNAEAHTG